MIWEDNTYSMLRQQADWIYSSFIAEGTIRATVADKHGEAKIVVVPDVDKVIVEPEEATVPRGKEQEFKAKGIWFGYDRIEGTEDDEGPFSINVEWSIGQADIGEVDPLTGSITTFTAIDELPANKKKLNGQVVATYTYIGADDEKVKVKGQAIVTVVACDGKHCHIQAPCEGRVYVDPTNPKKFWVEFQWVRKSCAEKALAEQKIDDPGVMWKGRCLEVEFHFGGVPQTYKAGASVKRFKYERDPGEVNVDLQLPNWGNHAMSMKKIKCWVETDRTDLKIVEFELGKHNRLPGGWPHYCDPRPFPYCQQDYKAPEVKWENGDID